VHLDESWLFDNGVVVVIIVVVVFLDLGHAIVFRPHASYRLSPGYAALGSCGSKGPGI
jgi:hypothetical protein